MKKFLLVFVLLFTVGLAGASAQTKNLTGRVLSAVDDSPIVGATVIIEGTNTGAITDNNGQFELTGLAGEVKLDVSFIGFEQKLVAVPAAQTNIVIKLTSSAIALQDVVVTGYGNYSKKSFTGAADNLNMEEVADMPAVNIDSKLAGTVSGVTITSNQGGPGAMPSIRIRGRGSINAGNDPLYVIDGVPMTTGNASTFNVGGGGNSILASLNPNDIANMTIIKDAAAASLYGSRAANGVIVITTKSGQAGKTNINVKANWGFSDMAVNYRPQLSGPERSDLLYHGFYNFWVNDRGYTDAKAETKARELQKQWASEPWSGWTDWKDLIFQKGFYQNYEASISGGNGNTKYFSSVSYTDQDGIVKQQNYERFTGRVNVNSTVGRFTFGANTLFSVVNQSLASTSTGTFGYGTPIVSYAWFAGPSQYPYIDTENAASNHLADTGYEEWDKGQNPSRYSKWFPAGGNVNPLEQSNLNQFQTGFNRTMISANAGFNIWDGLDIKETFSYDIINERSFNWWDPRSSAGRSENGSMERYSSQSVKMVSQTHLTYRQTFADSHSVDLLAGYEIEDNPYETQYSVGNDFASPYLNEIKNAAKTEGSWSSKSNTRLVSWLAKADYNYQGRYYLSGSYRRDGSSRLAPSVRWGNFWSVSGSWVISNERFVEPVADILTLAKIRASYGVNGTQPSDYYGYMGLYTYGYKYAGLGGMDLSQVENAGLTWEKNYATNVGIDLSLWNRLNLSVDYYNRDTKNLLLWKSITEITGFNSVLQNSGRMNNRGIEVSLNGDIVSNKDLYFNMGINLSHNRNRLLALEADNNFPIEDYSRIYEVGHPYYSFWAKEFSHIDPDTGEALYFSNKQTRDEYGNITEVDRELVSYDEASQIASKYAADPKLVGGLTGNLTWKGLDFSFVVTFQLGAHVFDQINYQFGTDENLYGGAVPIYWDYEETWQYPGDTRASLPLFKTGRASDQYSDKHIYSTDHLRLKSITLGYTFPKKWTNKIGIEKLRIYGAASNLLTWKKKECVVDPEMYGAISFESPIMKTVTFGIDISF